LRHYQNEEQRVKRIWVTRGVLLLFLGVGAFVAIWVSTRGKIVIEPSKQAAGWRIDNIQVAGQPKQQAYTAGDYISSREYSVTLSNDEAVYTQLVSVPKFLGSVVVDPVGGNEYEAVKRANNVGNLQVEVDGNIYSMTKDNEYGEITAHIKQNQFPYVANNRYVTKQPFTVLGVLQNQFIGLVSLPYNDTYAYFFGSLNPKTNTITKLGGNDATPVSDNPEGLTQQYYVFTNETSQNFVTEISGELYIFPGDPRLPATKVENAKDWFSYSANKPVVSTNGEYIVLYKGATFDASEIAGDSDPLKNINNNYEVRWLNSTTGELVSEMKASTDKYISLVSSSVDGKLAMTTNKDSILLVDRGSPEPTQAPINSLTGETYWLNNQEYAFLDPILGIRVGDFSSKGVRTVFYLENLQHGGIVVTGEEIRLVTYERNPDTRFEKGGMLLSLTKQQAPENRMLRALPHATLGYHLDTFNGKVYYTALSYGPRDKVFDLPINQRLQVAKTRLSEAKSYLATQGLSEAPLVEDIDIRSVEEFLEF
jgi:hypothetical protein